MSDKPLLLVLGGTGATGLHVVRKAVEGDRLRVRVYARCPSKLPADMLESPRVQVVEGTFSELDKVTAALKGARYVISTAGNKGLAKDRLMLRVATAVADAMPRFGVERFVYQAGAFSPAPGDPPLGVLWKVLGVFAPVVFGFREMIQDNSEVLTMLHGRKDINWVVTRPGMLAEGQSKGSLKKSASFSQVSTFVDLAQFNLDAALSGEHDGTAPFLAYGRQ